MNDDRIRELLRDLPRAEASPGFSRRVMERVDVKRRSAFSLAGFAWTAAALAAVLAVLSVGAWRVERSRTDKAARAEFAALRAEQRALAEELQRLQEQTSGASTVFLGGDDRVEFVMDLARPRSATTAQPATYRTLIQPAP